MLYGRNHGVARLHRYFQSTVSAGLVCACCFLLSQTAVAQKFNPVVAPPALLQEALEELERLSAGRQAAPSDRELRSFRSGLQLKDRKSETVNVADVTGSVTASARCAEGHVLRGSERADASDVEIVSTTLIDCADGVCRAYQVTANRKEAAPFSLDVSVTCSR